MELNADYAARAKLMSRPVGTVLSTVPVPRLAQDVPLNLVSFLSFSSLFFSLFFSPLCRHLKIF
jgi:hypothetical protein